MLKSLQSAWIEFSNVTYTTASLPQGTCWQRSYPQYISQWLA